MNKQNTLWPYVNFQTFMVVVAEMILFWVLTLCRIISLFWLFKGTCLFLPQSD